MNAAASVIIPTYNRRSQLLQCLESLRASTFDEPWEVVIVDDGGADGSQAAVTELAAGYPASLRVIRQENAGPAAARNAGIAAATAPFVLFTDDDCLPAARWVEAMVSALRRRPGDGVEGRVRPAGRVHPLAHVVLNETGGAYFTCNVAYPREVLQAVGGFDDSYPYPAAEDWDLAFRVLESGRAIAFEPDAVVVHPVIPYRFRDYRRLIQMSASMDMLFARFPRRAESYLGGSFRQTLWKTALLEPFAELRQHWKIFLAEPWILPPFMLRRAYAAGFYGRLWIRSFEEPGS